MEVVLAGSGGLAAVSAGISEEWVVLLLVLGAILVVAGAWKVGKLLWALFAG